MATWLATTILNSAVKTLILICSRPVRETERKEGGWEGEGGRVGEGERLNQKFYGLVPEVKCRVHHFLPRSFGQNGVIWLHYILQNEVQVCARRKRGWVWGESSQPLPLEIWQKSDSTW